MFQNAFVLRPRFVIGRTPNAPDFGPLASSYDRLRPADESHLSRQSGAYRSYIFEGLLLEPSPSRGRAVDLTLGSRADTSRCRSLNYVMAAARLNQLSGFVASLNAPLSQSGWPVCFGTSIAPIPIDHMALMEEFPAISVKKSSLTAASGLGSGPRPRCGGRVEDQSR